MSLRIYLIIAAIYIVVSGVLAGYIYEKGFSAGKEDAKIEQEKYEKKVKGNDVKIDKKTPFDADRTAQLGWLYGYTVRQ